MSLSFCPLFSGSSGNALYISTDKTHLLVDAGKNCKTIREALTVLQTDPAALDGILITHEHTDHISALGVLCRRYMTPVYATADTWAAIEGKVKGIPEGCRRIFDRESDFYIGDVGVQPFAISHDAADPVGYRLWSGSTSLSTVTDLGYFSRNVEDAVRGSHLILLESNYDPDLLRLNEHYSSALKNRIAGRRGHLSNDNCAEALLKLAAGGTKQFILGHLSGENNCPELAFQVSCERAQQEGIRLGTDLNIDLAYRERVGGYYTIA